MLITRLLTALIILPLVLAAILFLSPLYFAMFVGLAILVGAWEWSALAGIEKSSLRLLYVALVLFCLFLPAAVPIFALLSIAVFVLCWMLIAIISYQREGGGAGFQIRFVRGMIGIIVLVATWVSVVTLKSNPQFGPTWLILILLIVAGADVGAYFAGKFFGKKLLCSRVSPKKTWEGFFGGLCLSALIACIGGFFLKLSIAHYLFFLCLSVITALFSVVGDLAESLLKRIVNIKDSGVIFPGHGGMLDRLDSLSAASIVFVFGMMLL